MKGELAKPSSTKLPTQGSVLYIEIGDWLDTVKTPAAGDVIIVTLVGPLHTCMAHKLKVDTDTDILVVYDSNPGKCLNV